MKPEVRDIYQKIEPKRSTPVTLEKLPDGMGQRAMFWDLPGDILRPPPYSSHKTDNTEPYLMGPPKFGHEEEFENHETIKCLYISDAGKNLIDKLGYDWFRNAIYRQLDDKQKIGEGTESIVYKTQVADSLCIVKVVNTDIIKKLNGDNPFHLIYKKPNYLHKFGKTEKVCDVLKKINGIQRFKTFVLGKPPKDLVASTQYLIQEPVVGIDLEKINDHRGDLENFSELRFSPKERVLLGTTSFSDNGWFEKIKKFQEEVAEIEDVLFVAAGPHGENIFSEVDFNLPDWIFTGLDPNSGLPTVSLIDQAPAPFFSRRNDKWDEDEIKYKELSKKYKGDKRLRHLKRIKL